MRSGKREEAINDDGHQITGPHDDPAVPSTSGEPWSRREFLGAGAVAAVGLVTPGALWLPHAGAVATASPFTGTNALRLAMHVHASWSEGLAS